MPKPYIPSSTATIITGVVDTYANLPSPASAHTGEFWFVTTGSGGFLSALKVYKYPKGIYSPNTSNVWEQVPWNVKIAEDAITLVNITNWTEYIAYAQDMAVGDRLSYNNVLYRNLTGTQTATAPDTDTTNWIVSGVEGLNTTGYIYLKGDSQNPVANDERIYITSIYVIFQRYQSGTWTEINRIGGSMYVPRFLEIDKDVNAEIIVSDPTAGQVRNLIKTATFSNGTVVGDIFGDAFLQSADKLYKVKPVAPQAWFPIQADDTQEHTGTAFTLTPPTFTADGLAASGSKFKGTIPAGTLAQGKVFKQSDLVNPVWQNVTDFEFANGIGSAVDSVTGIIDVKPTLYLVGNIPLKYVFNFSQPVTLKGSNTAGTDIYFESLHSIVKFENIQVDNVESLTADATHIDNADYLVHTTASIINLNIPYNEPHTFTIRDADATFATNSCKVLIKDSGGSLQYTVTLDSSNDAFFFYHDGSYWNYSKDGAGRTYQITGDRTSSTDFPIVASGYWDRTGTTLSPITAGDQILTTGNVTAGSMNTGSIHYSGELNFVGVAGGTRITSDRGIYIQGTIESNYELTSRRVNLTAPATIESDVIRVVNSDGHGNFYLRSGNSGIQMRNTIYGAGLLWFALNDNGNVGLGKVTASEKLDVDGTVKATTFSGDLNGTINTVTTATTQDSRDISTKVATTEFVDTAISGINESKWARNETTKVLSPNNLGDSVSIASTTITEKALSVEANTLTTGAGLYVGSSSSGLNDKLVELSISDAGATGDVLAIDNNGTGQAIDITSNSTTNDVIKVVSDNLVSGSILSLNSASNSDILRDLIEIRHTGTGNSTSAIDINLGASRGSILNGYSSNTTLPALRLDSDNLTYGAVAHFASASADTNIRKLVHIQNSNAASSGTTGLVIDQASTGNAISTNGDIVTTGDLTAENVTVGNNLGISQSGVTNLVVGATANTSKLYFGQDTNRNLVIEWTYNATPEDASARMTTWGYANDFFIDGKVLSLQTKNSSGQVGIGTDDPQAKLDVRGNIRVGDWTSADVSMVGAPASGGDFNIGQTSGSGKIKFINNAGVDLITIQNDGDMGIGKVPTEKLDVNGTVKATAFSGDTARLESSVYQGVYGSQEGQVLGFNFSEVGSTTQYDKSPYANNATGTSAGLVTSTGGKYGSGAVLNGTTDYFTLSNSTGLPTGAAVRTIEALVKIDDITLQSGVIFRYGNEVDDDVFSLEQLDATLRIFTNNSSSDTGNILSEGNWFLIQATYNGTQVNMWVNGEKVITNSALTVNTASGTTPYIGSRGGSSDYFQGSIGFVKVYDRVLTADEINAHYLRGFGDSIIKSNEAKVMDTSGAVKNISLVAESTHEIFTAADLEKLAIGGVITVDSKMAFVFRNYSTPIVTSTRFVVTSTGGMRINGLPSTTYVYTGSSPFFTVTNAGLTIEGMTFAAASTGKLFDINNIDDSESISLRHIVFSGWDFGSITGGMLLFRFATMANFKDSLFLRDNSLIILNEAGAIRTSGSSANKPLFDITGRVGGIATITSAGGFLSTGETACRINPNTPDEARISMSNNSIIGTMFDVTGDTGLFDGVADASISATSITSVSDSSGIARFNYTGSAVYVGQDVVISGFTTNTAYNGTWAVSATGTGYFDISRIAFGTTETGSFLSHSVTFSHLGLPFIEGDGISIDTYLSSMYDGGSLIYNIVGNTFQVNKTWVATASGTVSTKGLTQKNTPVLLSNTPSQPSSEYLFQGYVNNNTTSVGAIVNNTFRTCEFGTLLESPVSERTKLLIASTGDFEYTGNEDIQLTLETNITAVSTGSASEFRFTWYVDKNTGTFVAIDTPNEGMNEISGSAGNTTLVSTAMASKGYKFQLRVTRDAGSSGLTIRYATITARG